jgi:hypothetical protein
MEAIAICALKLLLDTTESEPPKLMEVIFMINVVFCILGLLKLYSRKEYLFDIVDTQSGLKLA